MALTALADKGNVLHIYDFRVKPGSEDEFIRLFEQFDYSMASAIAMIMAAVQFGIVALLLFVRRFFYRGSLGAAKG